MSTVSKGDTYAVFMGLGEVLGDMMEAGNTVKLEGLGTFYLVGNANGRSVDSREEVGSEQFRRVTVAFISEYSRAQNNQIMTRTIVPSQVEWTELDGTVKK